MLDMVERVAKAICEDMDLRWEDQADSMTSSLGEDNGQDAFRCHAIAAIKAMCEPTDEMLDAGKKQMEKDLVDNMQIHIPNTYAAMLATALGETVL